MSKKQLWKPICYSNDIWGCADTTTFDRIAPSWLEYKAKLDANNGEFAQFVQRLKVEHSIETGIIEKLYDIDDDRIEGITVTLLKEGINSNFIQHGDVEDPVTTKAHIRDQLEAIDGLFDFIKDERSLSTSYIKELHALVTRSQGMTEAITPLGETIQIPLLRGEYKQQENNPSRLINGMTFVYCPPVQTSSEMDRLIEINNALEESNVHLVIRAAFFHHAMTTIHPFQDGNGRVVRLLTSLILIRGGFFPFSVKRRERNEYLDALSSADDNDVQPLVAFICNCQIRAIETALSLKRAESDTFDAVIDALKNRVNEREAVVKEAIVERRKKINDIIDAYVKKKFEVLKDQLGYDMSYWSREKTSKTKWSIGYQMGLYATKYRYFMKQAMPYNGFAIRLHIGDQRFQIQLFTHHFGYTDDVVAVGGVLETSAKKGKDYDKPRIDPLEVSPLNLSLLVDINETTIRDIQAHVERLVLVAMASIIDEI